MLYKTTTKLFKGTYQYKIVLICAGSSWFRSGDADSILDQLMRVDLNNNEPRGIWRPTFKNREELDYAFKLQAVLSKIQDIDIRVESPWISIYSNNIDDIDLLISIDREKVKYVSVPPTNTVLETGTIIMPKMDFEFRCTMGKTTAPNEAFVNWAETIPKLKLTKSCKKDLLRARSWGGSHFYVTGEKNLLMAKMHLGGCISKVERILKK